MITGQKETEGRHEELERRDRRRTAELMKVNAELRLKIVELEGANRALHHNDIGYGSLLDGVEVGAYTTTPTGRFIDANMALARMLGFTDLKALLKINVTSLYVDPKDRARLRAVLRRDGRVFGFDARMCRKDGTTMWARKGISAVCDREGRVVQYQGVAVDITGLKQPEVSLSSDESWLRGIPNALPFPQFVIDRSHRVVHWNRAMEDYSGIRSEEVLGTTRHWQAFYQNERPCMADLVLEGKTGEIAGLYSTYQRSRLIPGAFEAMDFFPALRGGVWLYFAAAPICDDRGSIIGVVENLLDFTERELATESLRESEERYRTLIERSNDGIAIVSGDVHVYASRRFAEILGYEKPDDLLGKTLTDFVHGDDCGLVAELVEKGQRGEPAPERHEFKGIKKDGTIVYLEASAKRIDHLGQPMTLAFLRDVTDRKLAEEEKERLKARLVQAEKMEAIGTLAGGIAHDFNNILTILMGYANLLCARLDRSDPLRVYVEHILSASEKATALTQSLLAFTRRNPFSLAPLDLNRLIKGTEGLLRRLITEDIALRIRLGTTQRSILGDPVQIDQILLNLVSNARDAMPQGGTLTIATAATYFNETAAQLNGLSRAGHYTVLTVADTGCGMDEITKEKVFEPFYTTKERGKGTGLGLSTVYGIVKQHSGSITVHSEVGKGTTFRISFPAVKARAEISRTSDPNMAEGTETILVAEDDDDVRGFIKETLEYSGYTVVEAVDGEEAVARFQEHRGIDLVILDTIMPKRNGKEAFDAISRCNAGVKVLFTSGYTGEVLTEKGVLTENFAFIPKPVSAADLLTKIRQALDG